MVGREEGHYSWFTTCGGDSLLVASSSRQASVGRRSGGPPKTSPPKVNLRLQTLESPFKIVYTKTGECLRRYWEALQGTGRPGGKTCDCEGLDKTKSRGLYEAWPREISHKLNQRFFEFLSNFDRKTEANLFFQVYQHLPKN